MYFSKLEDSSVVEKLRPEVNASSNVNLLQRPLKISGSLTRTSPPPHPLPLFAASRDLISLANETILSRIY